MRLGQKRTVWPQRITHFRPFQGRFGQKRTLVSGHFRTLLCRCGPRKMNSWRSVDRLECVVTRKRRGGGRRGENRNLTRQGKASEIRSERRERGTRVARAELRRLEVAGSGPSGLSRPGWIVGRPHACRPGPRCFRKSLPRTRCLGRLPR